VSTRVQWSTVLRDILGGNGPEKYFSSFRPCCATSPRLAEQQPTVAEGSKARLRSGPARQSPHERCFAQGCALDAFNQVDVHLRPHHSR
jgi:hypothetical protein